jgi:hypothetical protein
VALLGGALAGAQQFSPAARHRVAAIQGDAAHGKMAVMKEKERRRKRLQREWGAPDPP